MFSLKSLFSGCSIKVFEVLVVVMLCIPVMFPGGGGSRWGAVTPFLWSVLPPPWLHQVAPQNHKHPHTLGRAQDLSVLVFTPTAVRLLIGLWHYHNCSMRTFSLRSFSLQSPIYLLDRVNSVIVNHTHKTNTWNKHRRKTNANYGKPSSSHAKHHLWCYGSSSTPAVQSWVVMAPGVMCLFGQSWLLSYLDGIPMGNEQLQRTPVETFVIWGSATVSRCFAPWCRIVGWEMDPVDTSSP